MWKKPFAVFAVVVAFIYCCVYEWVYIHVHCFVARVLVYMCIIRWKSFIWGRTKYSLRHRPNTKSKTYVYVIPIDRLLIALIKDEKKIEPDGHTATSIKACTNITVTIEGDSNKANKATGLGGTKLPIIDLCALIETRQLIYHCTDKGDNILSINKFYVDWRNDVNLNRSTNWRTCEI